MRQWLGHNPGPQEAMPSRREHLVVELHLLLLALIAGDTKNEKEGVRTSSRVTDEELNQVGEEKGKASRTTWLGQNIA